MAQDATGTPTPKGIPKFNTAVDAPSGKGFNAAMDVIDGLLNYIKVRKNSGGSDFERQRLNLVEGSNITLTVSDDAGNNEVDVTIASSSSAPTYQTTLPGAPTDGQETILVDSTTAPTYSWLLRYNSTLAKWEFIGGRPAFAEVATSETTSSATYTALATAGPSIVLPVAGDYLVAIGAKSQPSTTSTTARMSYDIGGTGAVDVDAYEASWGTAGDPPLVNGTFQRVKTGLSAVTLTAKYRNSTATTATFAKRWMSVYPVKLG